MTAVFTHNPGPCSHVAVTAGGAGVRHIAASTTPVDNRPNKALPAGPNHFPRGNGRASTGTLV